MENLLGSKEGQLRWKKLNVSRPWGRRKDGPSSSETDRSTGSALERWERWWWGGREREVLSRAVRVSLYQIMGLVLTLHGMGSEGF